MQGTPTSAERACTGEEGFLNWGDHYLGSWLLGGRLCSGRAPWLVRHGWLAG